MDAKRAKTGLTTEERQLYEHTLSKYKGIWERFQAQLDERDAIQKKTFTKWVNKHLKKANRHVDDLFTDLQDGLNLISLLEVLSGEHLLREKGRMRFHALQNVELVLTFLRHKKIKLVNIRPEDIVDGNPKLTLGLIWTIILHFQISDIVLSQNEENVSPREVLLKWARKSTARYPEVKVQDFTSSWRDGYAFNALIHRNRPDLIDWRQVKTKTVRDRLEHAFHSAEKVGVTRLLDPEDVDTHEIDEKSIITYISSIYDVFPEPPPKHPLYDNESITHEYRDVASSLHLWIREWTSVFSERTLPATLQDLVKASQESTKFKSYEVPARQGERQKILHLYTELQKQYESTGEVDIEPELHVDVLDRNWNKLLSLHQERDQQLQDEIKKFERLDRLADRLSRDCKRVDSRLDDVDSRVNEESRRLERLHPLDAKRNAESLESEMRSIEETIQGLFQDLGILKTVGHSAAPNLERRVQKLHQKWVALRSSLHSKLIARLASMSFPVVEERTVTRQTRTVLETRLVDTNHHFRSLQQAIEWCRNKLKLINESELGNDLAGVKIELSHHQREHKEIDRFQTTVEQCASAKNQFQGEEQTLYLQHLNTLHKVYSELLTTSNKRLSDLESLLDFLQSVQNQTNWLSDKELVEISRDWSDPNINLNSVQHYHDGLMSELEKREVSVRSVIERGNSLALQGHPGSKTITKWTEILKESWSRLLQFSLACEIHTEATRKYQEYIKDLGEAEAWLRSRDELLNTVYSASEFTLDEGERLLKGMQEMREDLNRKAPAIAELAGRAAKIPPIQQRRLPITRPIQVTAVCNYSSDAIYVEKDDVWLLHDNSALTHWRVSSLSTRSNDINVPSVVFLIPPPGREVLEAAERLNRAFESTTSLWQRKQMRLRQNMIFATIRVVRSWDLAQFVSMGSEQRNAIRRALNEDAEKLLSEGDPSDPQLRRLRREIDEVNALFEELERRARLEDEQKFALREFTETSTRIQSLLDEYERTLNNRLFASIPRDVHSLEHLILQHKDFENDINALTPQIESLQSAYNALPRKNQALQSKVESILQQWNLIWNYSRLYVDRLKCVETVLASLDEARNVVSELELKLVSLGDMPSELEPLRDLHDDLVRLQNAIAARQPVVDQLIDDATNVRRIVVRSRDRTKEREHADLDRLDEDVNTVTRRWNDLCANLVDRLRSCESAGAILDNFGQTYQTEVKFIDESYTQLNDLPPVTNAKHHVEPTKVLFTSIVERTQPLEQVNIDGGRFIREAKIYAMSLRKYTESIVKWNPTYDPPYLEDDEGTTTPKGAAEVEAKLDEVNQKFLSLITIMQDRLRQMAALTGDPELKEFVSRMKPAQLKTFRTVFSISETTRQINNKWSDSVDMGNKINGSSSSREPTGIGTDLADEPCLIDPKTGRTLTVSEAIRSRLLDVRTGMVLGLPLTEAVSAGLITAALASRLLQPGPDKKTMLEHIKKELADAETNLSLYDCSTLKLVNENNEILDRATGIYLPLKDAIKINLLSDTNYEIYSDNKKITLNEALKNNISIENFEKPLSLKDVIDKNMYQDNTIVTKIGTFTIEEALNAHILTQDKTIHYNNIMLTIPEALESGLLKNGFFDNFTLQEANDAGYFFSNVKQPVFDIGLVKYDDEYKSLRQLHDEGIFKNGLFGNQTLKDLEEKGAVRSEISDLLYKKIGVKSSGKELNCYDALSLNLLDINTGLLVRKDKLIGFDEALKKKLITKEGLSTLKSLLCVNISSVTIKEPVEVKVKEKSKFIKFLDKLSNKFPEKGYKLKDAIDSNLLNPIQGVFIVPGTDREVSFEECVTLNIIDENSGFIKGYNLSKALKKGIINSFGYVDDKNIKECLQEGIVTTDESPIKVETGVIYDPTSSLVIYTKTGECLPLLEAVQTNRFDIQNINFKGDLNEAIKARKFTVKGEKIQRKIIIDKNLKPLDLSLRNVYDIKNAKFIKPFSELLPYFDETLVKTDKGYITLKDALDAGIINEKGEMLDASTGKIVPFFQAVKIGWIISQKTNEKLNLTLTQAVQKKILDPETGLINNMDLSDGILDGILDPNKISIKLDQLVDLTDALDNGFDLKNVKDYYLQGFLREKKPPVALEVIPDCKDPITNKILKWKTCTDVGLIDPDISQIYTQKWEFLNQLPPETNLNGKKIRTLMDPKSIIYLITNNYYDNFKFFDPRIDKYITLKEGLGNGLIDDDVLIKDPKNDKLYSISESEVLDKENGWFLYPYKMDLKTAYEKGYIIPKYPPMTLPEAVMNGLDFVNIIDTPCLLNGKELLTPSQAIEKGLLRDNHYKGLTLNQALAAGILLSQKTFSLKDAVDLFYDRKNNKFNGLTLKEAVHRKLINPHTTVVSGVEPFDIEKDINYEEAFKHGKLIDVKKPLGLKKAFELNVHNLFYEPKGEFVTLKTAVDKGLIDGKNNYVGPHFIPLEDAINEELISNDLTVSGTPLKDCYVDKTEKKTDLKEILKNNLYNKETGKIFVKSKELSISNAFKLNLLENIDLCKTNGKTFTLKEAIANNLIQQGLFCYQNVKLPLDVCYNLKLLEVDLPEESLKDRSKRLKVDVEGKSSLGNCISIGLIDPAEWIFKGSSLNKIIEKLDTESEGYLKGNLFTMVDGNKIIKGNAESFASAIKNKKISNGYYGKLTIMEAINKNLLDPNSLIIKDTQRRRFFKVPEAYKKGLTDDKLNTLVNGKLYNLSDGLAAGIFYTDGLSIFDSIDYQIYNPTNGLFTDPFSPEVGLKRRRLDLTSAMATGLLDSSSALVRTDGVISSIKDAIGSGALDPTEGRLRIDSGENLDLMKAKDRGFVIQAESRQAMEEKYRVCDISLRQLIDWMGDFEERLARQEPARESPEGLREQINIIQLLKEELESQQRVVQSALDDVRNIVSTGSEYLTRDEVISLERNAKSLRNRYDRADSIVERLLRRINSAGDELNKFRSEARTFTEWLGKAKRLADEKERSVSLKHGDTNISELVSDVISHQADLRFITMAAQKFSDESREFLSIVNEYRSGLSARPGKIEPYQSSEIRQIVNDLTREYKDLYAKVTGLSEKMSGLGGRQREFRSSLDRAKQWLMSVEPRANKILAEPLAADPHSLEDQLSRTKSLSNEFAAQSRLFDNLRQSLDALLRSVEGASRSEIDELVRPVEELTTKYDTLSSGLVKKAESLEHALSQSQGVESSLESIVTWLSTTENNLKALTRPASLNKARLEEQVRGVRSPLAEILAKKPTIESVVAQADKLIKQGTNPRLAKRVESKVKDVTSRYEKLVERATKLSELLNEVSTSLDGFERICTEIENWLQEASDNIALGSADAVSIERDSKRELVESVLREGKALLSRKDVTDTSGVRDRLKNIETAWRDLNVSLDERVRLGKLRAEQSLAYDKLKEQIILWLNNFESKINRLDAVALHMDIIKRQSEELKPLVKEHRDFAPTIDRLFELAQSIDLDRSESPNRRRSSTQIKRLSIGGRKSSQEILSPSPTKFVSPMSPVSSGFGSRRSSQDAYLETTTQQETAEINNRYSALGVKLSERSSEIESTREELRKSAEHLKALDGFLERTTRALPRETLCSSKDEADKVLKIVKGLLEEMYEKQSLLDSTKTSVSELLRKKPNAPGSDALQQSLTDITNRWKQLNDLCKYRIQLLEDLKDLYDTHDHLGTWLSAKERMVSALGPISSDPRMVQSQVEQVQVLREELRTMRPQLSHLETTTATLVTKAKWTPLEAKLKSVTDRWSSLAKKLDERAACLGAAVDSSREFDLGLNRLRDTLQNISDQIDAAQAEKDPEQHLRKLQSCERQLEGARQLLADAEAAGEELCKVLTDAASRAEIQGKLSAVNKQYKSLQDKLDQRKAEIESYLKDGREFEAAIAKTLGWLSDELGSMTERLLISADRDILQQQVDNHEPIYKEVLSKEHQIIMLLDRGPVRSDKSRHLDTLRTQWDRLRREVMDRQTRLSTSMEHCRRYYKSFENFIPWLVQAETKLESLRPDSFSRRDLDKHLRDLTNFRNDVWKKSGEFELLRSLGETFVGSCDIDKEVVAQEMATAKNRWDKLNNELLSKTSALEELGRKLADASDRLRGLSHSIQLCEDRLGSHDSISAYADPTTIARLAGLRDEVGTLRKPLHSLSSTCSELDNEVSHLSPGRTSGLGDEVAGLSDRLDDLSSRLDDRFGRAQVASKAVQQYNDKVKHLTADLTSLEDELSAMKPPGRDMKTLRSQQDQLSAFNERLNKASDDVSTMASLADSLVDSGFSADATRQQAENVAKRLAMLESASRKREETLDQAMEKLKDFNNKVNKANSFMDSASDEIKRLKPVGSEPETIKSQQEETSAIRSSLVEPAGIAVESALSSGQILVQTASPGVNTSVVEKECEKISERWNDLKDKINDRDRRLDVGLLQSGKFQEALEGLSKWLLDTEEMVANQKAPSYDYNVVKAQLQEQKCLKKMLNDHKGAMSSLVSMGREVGANCDPQERSGIERQLRSLSDRFGDLTEKAAGRMTALEEAMAVAKLFNERLNPVTDWLDKTEKKIKDMELVPTDEEKIQQRIREHSSLHDDILRKKNAVSELTDIAERLASLVSDDDAALVASRVQKVADRYLNLVSSSEDVAALLENARARLRHLVVTYQQLQSWMDSMDHRLNQFKVLAVHKEQLMAQTADLLDLTEEISNQQENVDSTVSAGLDLMRNISSDEAIQLKDKLDQLQRRQNELTTRGSDLLKQAHEALPLVQQFHSAHNRLVDWMHSAETTLQNDPREESVRALELDVQEFRPVLENINQLGPQLCSIGPGEGAATIEGLVTRDNRRFESIADQVQRKSDRLQRFKQHSMKVLGDVDSLLEWFREVEAQLREAEPPSSEPQVIRVQLKEHKALNDDIASQKGRVRDALETAKRVLRESPQHEDTSVMREKTADLRETMEAVWKMSGERLGLLEQAYGLAQHFETSHFELVNWLDEKTAEANNLRPSSLRPQALIQDQAVTQSLLQSITEHKPLVDKLNKTGDALIKLVAYEEGAKVQDILDSDNSRYNELRNLLKSRQEALEKALQESSEFSDKLEGMLRALSNAADEMNSAEPVSAHPPKIKQQLKENQNWIDEVSKREDAFEAVKKAASDVIAKSPNDPAVRDIKKKLEKLQQLWKEVNDATKTRSKSLKEALEIAAKFWSALEAVMVTLAEIERTLIEQEPPALKPELVRKQGEALGAVKEDIDRTKPRVDEVRKTGASLMAICGEPDKPEVRKNIEDLDSAWDTVTSLFAKREENLLNAMERAMEFHDTLKRLKEFLTSAESKFASLGPLGEDIGTIRRQMKEVKDLKASLDPMMIEVEKLNRQAAELTERSTAEQAQGLKESLSSVNTRWDELHRGIAERYRQLENAMLRLGQFQQALTELLTWINSTDRSLDSEMSPTAVDPHLLEVQLAKLKVLMNDMNAHQSSVDTLNDAGRQIVEESNGADETTQDRLKDLNRKWKALLHKAADRQTELEEALRQGQRFAAEIQDLLGWLGEVDAVIAASKPVGGLPETASEQLDRFMVVYDELETSRPRVEGLLSRGAELLKKSPSEGSSQTQNNLKTLKSRWEHVTNRANDKKIKLEIALKEATEFHEALQNFVDWLTSAEKSLSNLKPVSRVLETILSQIEEHKAFQKEVGVHRETMLQLDKKGTHLKYFSQKQDVILIKNLLISVQHRWDRVVSKSAERTRALDHGYKEAKDFHDSWSHLMNWLKDTDSKLDVMLDEINSSANDPIKLKQRLAKHKETQKALAGKQTIYDSTLRSAKTLRERAPKSDEHVLKSMAAELKDLWNTVCSKAVQRQRNLEEALLYCGQVKDALDALLDWLRRTSKELNEDAKVHGDLDTVQMLIEQHKSLEQELENRKSQVESVERSGRDLASKSDGGMIEQINEMTELWRKTVNLAQKRGIKLQGALRQAEELHKSVHMLLEWLSDAEMKLRFVENLPDDEGETRIQMTEHERFLREMVDKEREKDATIRLAEEILAKAHPDGAAVVKHWITIIQSRWEEVTSWAKQRQERLKTQLRALQDMDSLLEELLSWLGEKESTLISLEHQILPENIPETERLINEHQSFMEINAKRTSEIDTVVKSKTVKERKQSKKSTSTQELHELSRKQSLKSSREQLIERRTSRSSPLKDDVPHIGPKFPAKGSKTPEPQFKCARSRLLYDRWRSVWLMSWERQRRLRDHMHHLAELEKLANFSWDEWRKRFLRFMNHKKSRLTDLFRKMDKNNDGLIPRDDFADGIIKTKFDTNKPEMGAVADMFDHNSEGLIDWQEFIAALRPDWEEKKPNTEAEKIHDEVKRLVMLCTCRQKFRVFQVGEGKYRFGDSQKLRLVRILRSTVMVRVGGGWVALEEFLVKNDPCRAKGRTNIELREQFILADGVSQSMSAFKPKTGAERKTSTPTGSQGPITKIREKSSRSVPMGSSGATSRATPGSVDSLSDIDSPSFSATPRKSSLRPVSAFGGGSLPGSRPGSRQGSKPPSRHGSNLSLASSDDGTPSRIPRRSTTTRTSTGTTRKVTTTSTVNGTKSPSTRGNLSRASSIPTLANRTPSGRTTPKSSR